MLASLEAERSKAPQPVSAEAIRRAVLGPDTVLLEYLVGEAETHLWAIAADGFHQYTLPGEAVLRQRISVLYRALTERNRFVEGETAEQRQARLRMPIAKPQTHRRRSTVLSCPFRLGCSRNGW